MVPYGATVERFLQRLRNEGRSPRTVVAYRADLDDTMVDVATILGLLRRSQAGQGAAWPERDVLVLVLALVCGLRLEEIARLRVADLAGTVPDGVEAITVRGKGDKERRLGLSEVVQEALKVYWPTRRAVLDR